MFLKHTKPVLSVQIGSLLQRNCRISLWGTVARDLAGARFVWNCVGVCGYEGYMRTGAAGEGEGYRVISGEGKVR